MATQSSSLLEDDLFKSAQVQSNSQTNVSIVKYKNTRCVYVGFLSSRGETVQKLQTSVSLITKGGRGVQLLYVLVNSGGLELWLHNKAFICVIICGW